MKFSTLLLTLTVTGTSAFAPTAHKQTFGSALSAIDDKTEVREYFNTEGFNRWNKIYSDSDEVNKVQMDIRDGHGQTIQKILNWVEADGDIAGKSVCDCGCGVGSLAIPLAQMGTLCYVDLSICCGLRVLLLA
jgi:magnesium-protoporphyrin O-methyltransferase